MEWHLESSFAAHVLGTTPAANLQVPVPWLQVPVTYGFGHGLSYTELQYSSLRVSAEPLSSASAAATFNVSVDVRNAGRC